ncbi:MAG: 50S ribosomal protein L24 [Chromatiales bacterium]|nr:50S ribosomal protein L24 [Chromatiales bacterium]
MKKIRKGDQVTVISGRNKGQQGRVLSVIPENDTIVVENVNIVKKMVRPNPDKGEQGGIIERESPLHISNVMLYNPKTNKGERVGFKINEDGNKVRYFKKSNEEIN